MGKPTLYVAFYRPRYGNYQHWALYLETDAGDEIFEVTGSHPNFRPNTIRADPRSSGSFLRLMLLDTISQGDIGIVRQEVQKTAVDNETVEWDCREYVLDIIERLEEECVLDVDDREYAKRKRSVKAKRGAIV